MSYRIQHDVDSREFDKALQDMRRRIPGAIRHSMSDSMHLVGNVAVSKYMDNPGAVRTSEGFRPSRKRISDKLHIRTSRLARSLTDNFVFSGGAIPGTLEGIRRILHDGDEYIGEYGSSVPYAAIHEFGGTVTPRGYVKVVPKRPYLNPALAASQKRIYAIFRARMDEAMQEVD